MDLHITITVTPDPDMPGGWLATYFGLPDYLAGAGDSPEEAIACLMAVDLANQDNVRGDWEKFFIGE